MMTYDDQKNSIKLLQYECKNCGFKSGNKNDLMRHNMTAKHKMMTNDDCNNIKSLQTIHSCGCGKKYKFKQGLSVHKKKCIYKESDINEKNNELIIDNSNENIHDYKELVMKLIVDNQEIKNIMMNSNKELLKENQELKKHLTQQGKQITDLIPLIGNNNNNNIKQKFNINVFLNEKCKDAISIDQFIDTIEVSMKNLLTTRDKGLGEGLSSIIIDNMNKLSLYERPIHCTDKKRETMYIKNHKWIKDDKLEQIEQLLKRVENKQLKNIKKWTDINPNFMESEKLQEEYMLLIKGCTSSIDECKVKAIKKVCDKVYLDKE